jgi:hypothetical protein
LILRPTTCFWAEFMAILYNQCTLNDEHSLSPKLRESKMDEELKQRLQEKTTWMRAVYMIMFAIIFGLLEIVIATVVVLQFFLSLFTGSTNERMVQLGQSLSTYLYQITLFLTFNSNTHPYPFGAWPKGAPTETQSKPKAAPKKKSKTKEEKTDKKPEA